MSSAHNRIPKLLVCLVGMTLASAAVAQAPRSSVDIAASTGAPGVPRSQDRPGVDPGDGRPGRQATHRTGRQGLRSAGAERALKVAEQRLRGRPVGTVPVTAGPTVPIVAMDTASLRAVPGQRWQAVLYLDNNSANPVDPVIECRFTNGGNTVMETRALVQTTAPSVRQGLAIYGPKTDVFVDRVSCRVAAP